MIIDIFESLGMLLFPAHCPVCQRLHEKRGAWCSVCLEKTLHPHRLALFKEQLKYIDDAFTLGYYHGTLQKLIGDVKFLKKKKSLPYLETFILQAEMPKTILEAQYALKIPLYFARQKERTFNQNDLFFDPFLQQYKIKTIESVARIKNTLPQYGLKKKERAQNMKNAFQLQDDAHIKGNTILILDDIFTTGTTITECAKILKKNGAKKIIALTLASDHS